MSFENKHNKRIPERVRVVKKLLDDVKDIQNITNIEINNYLDLGCGDGNISTALSEELNIKNTYCSDVIKPDLIGENINFLPIDEKENKIDLPDNSVNLITCFMSIHHFKNLSKMINEIDRISIKNTDTINGTYLIIREHDCNKESQPYLDFVHLIYLVQKKLNISEYYSSYYKRSDLQKSLEIHGWKYITSYDYPTDSPNPQKIYSSIFLFTGINKQWISPFLQTSDYKLNEDKLLSYICKLNDKKMYVKVLRKYDIPEYTIKDLLYKNNNKDFSELLQKYLPKLENKETEN